MGIEQLQTFSIVFGALFAGMSALAAVATYIRSYLRQRAADVRGILVQCEQALRKVYMDFDSQGLVQTSTLVFSDPAIREAVAAILGHRNLSSKAFAKRIEAYSFVFNNAVVETMAHQKGPLVDLEEAYRGSMERVRHDYPVLFAALQAGLEEITTARNLIQDARIYTKIIERALIAMHQERMLGRLGQAVFVVSALNANVVSNIRNSCEQRFSARSRTLGLPVSVLQGQGRFRPLVGQQKGGP